ncbi:MAG: ATP-binding cassette domain-containing protein [Desulfarculaceae bacterium]
MQEQALIEVRGLEVSFRQGDALGLSVIQGLDLEMGGRGCTALLGPSGAGKSVMAKAVAGLLPTDATLVRGDAWVLGRKVMGTGATGLGPARGVELLYLPQASSSCLNPTMRVHRQVAEGAALNQGLSRRAAAKRAEQSLHLVGLSPSHFRRYPFQLSGGMRQRVMLAMALAIRPKVLVVDEPTTGLDTVTKGEIVEVMKTMMLNGEIRGALVITHDLGVALALAHTIVVMEAGRIVEVMPSRRFLRDAGHLLSRRLADAHLRARRALEARCSE